MSKITNRRDALNYGVKKIVLPGVALSVWIKPITNTVFLPAHAMTSVCSSSDMLGLWNLEVFDRGAPFERMITFLPGGTTDNPFIHTWEVIGETVRMTQDVSDWIFTGQFNSACDELSGTYIHNPVGVPQPPPETGTWRAIKL